MQGEYTQASKKQHKILFTRKEGQDSLILRVLVLDPTLKIPQDPSSISEAEIEAKVQIYETESPLIVGEPTAQRLFNAFDGIDGYVKHMSDPDSWELNDRKFVTRKSGKPIKPNIELEKLELFKVLSLKDLLLVLKNQLNLKVKSEIITQIPKDQEEGDAIRAKKQSYEKVRSDTFGIEAFSINGPTIIKKECKNHSDRERFVFGKTTLTYSSQFTIRIDKLTKQFRNPAIWIGFADAKENDKQKVEQCMEHVIAISDKKKLYRNGHYLMRYQSQAQDFIPTEDFILADEISYIQKQLYATDEVTVKVNKNTGEVTWSVEDQVYASCFFTMIKDESIEWVPFVELWKTGDTITWIK